jgi:hypothetical protein
MSDEFHFDEKTSSSSQVLPQKKRGMAHWLVSHSWGVIKNEAQANGLLIAFVVVAGVLMVAMNTKDDEMKIKAPPGREIINEPGVPPRLK